jgi:hypothetical protein
LDGKNARSIIIEGWMRMVLPTDGIILVPEPGGLSQLHTLPFSNSLFFRVRNHQQSIGPNKKVQQDSVAAID